MVRVQSRRGTQRENRKENTGESLHRQHVQVFPPREWKQWGRAEGFREGFYSRHEKTAHEHSRRNELEMKD